MNRWLVISAALLVAALMSLGCSSGSGGSDPVTPDVTKQNPAIETTQEAGGSHSLLWGYYDVYLDLEKQEAEVVVNRNAMFALNVVYFLNKNPANLTFEFNGVDNQGTYVDVDLNVSIRHPIPAKPQLNGYDVRGILIGEGSEIMQYNSDLRYPVFGMDQYLLNADGYTRWFNRPEFPVQGVFGYTQGIYASKNLIYGDGTVNPYKYFADGLGPYADVWEWLNLNPDSYGVFSSGSTNTRNYVIRFPLPVPAIQYGYAVMASWAGVGPGDHPSNAPEDSVLTVTVTPDIYYSSPTVWGGDLIFDFGFWIWDWSSIVSTTIVESTVLDSTVELPIDTMEPIEVGDNYAVFHVDIPATSVTTTTGNEMWLVMEYEAFNYTNEFGVPNLAGTDPLAAFFRFDVPVSDHPFNQDPVCDLVVVTPMPAEGPSPVAVEFDASGSYDPDGDPITFTWDFNGDGVFGDSYGGLPNMPTHEYGQSYSGDVCVRVEDDQGGMSECCAPVEVNIVGNQDPVCDLVVVTPMPAEGPAPVDVEFDASGSYDPDDDPITFEWDFDGDGTYGESPDDDYTGSPDNPTHSYTSDYIGDVCVRVSDDQGGDSECCEPVEVDITGNQDPVCDLIVVSPNPGYGHPDAVMEFDASGSDDPDEDPITFEWDFDGDGVFGESPDDDYTGDPSTPSHSYAADYDGEVCVRVSDGLGGEDTCCVEVLALAHTLYYYDGEINDGGIMSWTDGFSIETWEYCPDMHAWDEELCTPYAAGDYRLAMTPFMTFPGVGEFTTLHLEMWHWGDMQDDEAVYGSPGTVEDVAGDYDFQPNWRTEALDYIEGFDFNDTAINPDTSLPYHDWSFVYGSEESPEWSHFSCDAYAGNTYAIGFQFEEYGAGNPLSQEGWDIRKLVVWVEP